MKKSRNHIEGAMRSHGLVFFFVIVLLIFGFISLPKMKKNEFPTVTVLQGVVAVVYPGATAEEIEVQVANPVEDYLFTFTDIDKTKTYSYSKDGMLYIFASLKPGVENSQVTWSRIREGLTLFRLSSLPQGVLATVVIDDFGNASSLFLAIESEQRSSRELKYFTEQLCDRLRDIPEMGNIKIVGEQKEEIAILMDPIKLSQYGISPSLVSAELAAHGFRTISGQASNNDGQAKIHVSIPYSDEYDLLQLVVFADPVTGQSVRLRDVAKLERRYKENTPYIKYTDEEVADSHCLVLSMEMRPGNNVVDFGKKVEKEIAEFQSAAPPDLRFHRITDQPKTVNASVTSFLKDLIEAVIIVILVMLLLFPLRTAIVSSTSVPVCIAITFGIMYLLGIELNTVTLAAMIVVLGMVVDDSVVVIDGYTEMLNKGHSRWYSAAVSTKSLVASMVIATCSISGMFFPMLGIIKGTMGDFIKMFPWAIFFALTCSILYAIWVIPYLSTRMIRPSKNDKPTIIERAQAKFFGSIQNAYQKLLNICFRHRWGTIIVALLFVGLGVFFFLRINVQMLPKAERDSFAVEIHLASGSSIQETAMVADSLTRILQSDKRITSVTSFIGMSSPRFFFSYAPQLASDAYAQFIVTTQNYKATKELVKEYQKKYENHFPNAQIRFRQMDYQMVAYPIEVYLKSDDYAKMEPIKDSLLKMMWENPHLNFVRCDYDGQEDIIEVNIDTDEANRLGITQSMLSIYLSGALSGTTMSSSWEGDYNLPITVYTEGVHDIDYASIGDLLIPAAEPGMWVPLRQVASIEPKFHHSNIPHRNGMRCITISADMSPGYGQMREWKKVENYLNSIDIPEGVTWEPGGSKAFTNELMPGVIMSIIAAILVMFLVLVFHYRKIGISVLSISVASLCLFGSCFGLWLFGLDFSITAILGVISLIGIIVRNAIIMYDYANELVETKKMPATEAAYEAGLRRMRPIFLTSATTALGVIPMIIAATMLWEPMGVVICFGTLFTLPLAITVLPVAYSLAFSKNRKK